VKVTQNWRNGSLLKLSKSEHDVKNRSTIFGPELTLSIRKKLEYNLVKSDTILCRKIKIKIKRIFMGLILFQFMRDAFAINIDIVSE